jgi:hypothetical protein
MVFKEYSYARWNIIQQTDFKEDEWDKNNAF